MADDGDAPLLRIQDDGAVRRLTLNRPSSANAFNRALNGAFVDGLRAAADDDSVSVVVVTGEGKVFSGGADLADLGIVRDAQRPPTFERDDDGPDVSKLIPAFTWFPKPLIAAVNGAAVGIGATMLLHCDAVSVSDRARIRFPFTALGIAPEASSTLLLPRLIGRQQAARLFFTSEWVDAERAVELGLAMSVSPHDQLLDDAHALAQAMAEQPLATLLAAKELMLEAERDLVEAANKRESRAFRKLLEDQSARAHLPRSR